MVPLSILESKISVTAGKLVEGGEGLRSVVYWPGVQREVERWELVNRHLAAVTRNFSNHFSVQMTLSMFTTGFYFVSMLYQAISCVITMSVSEVGDRFPTLLVMILVCGLSVVLTAGAGQRVQNKAEQLERKLALFYTVLIQIPEESVASCARAAAALSRRLRAAPLRVRLLGAQVVRAALLLDVLALVANYTVVLLQYSHVV